MKHLVDEDGPEPGNSRNHVNCDVVTDSTAADWLGFNP